MKIVVFSGAGMSAESGIATFRDADGLWENYAIEDVATPQAWAKNPTLVQDFYNQRRKQIVTAKPNVAHIEIAELEQFADVQVITQNIDDLHEKAGSTQVLHLHGEIMKSKSSGPNAEREYYPIDGWELKPTNTCPDGFTLRPHVVWFGEEVPLLDTAAEIIRACDVLLVIGTSLQVYPAAGLIFAASKDTEKILIDPNADRLQAPAEFKKIALPAGEGVHSWRKEKGLIAPL